MIETTFFDRWIVAYDADATRRAYTSIEQGWADECLSLQCKNFAAARDKVFSSEVLQFFEIMGIDYRKEAEVWAVGPPNHTYEGVYHFVGSVGYIGDELPKTLLGCGEYTPPDFVQITPEFALRFRADPQLVQDEFRGKSVASIELCAEAPWLIDAINELATQPGHNGKCERIRNIWRKFFTR